MCYDIQLWHINALIAFLRRHIEMQEISAGPWGMIDFRFFAECPIRISYKTLMKLASHFLYRRNYAKVLSNTTNDFPMFQVREQRMKTAARPSDQDLAEKQEFGEALGLGAAGKELPYDSVMSRVARPM